MVYVASEQWTSWPYLKPHKFCCGRSNAASRIIIGYRVERERVLKDCIEHCVCVCVCVCVENLTHSIEEIANWAQAKSFPDPSLWIMIYRMLLNAVNLVVVKLSANQP
jgi:hypothetical protein